eukprot:134619-Ditylum_brightwellii.AAC.1
MISFIRVLGSICYVLSTIESANAFAPLRAHAKIGDVHKYNTQLAQSTTEINPTLKNGPLFLEALIGIAINGSPWEYMLKMKEKGYD